MKKLTLLTAGLFAAASLGGQAMTAEAASLEDAQVFGNGNSVIITYGTGGGNNCDFDIPDQVMAQIKDQIMDQVKDLLENKWNSCLPSVPDQNAPDTNTPDADNSGNGGTDTNKPENKPETGNPGNDSDDAGLSYIEQVVELVNQERVKRNLAPLTIDQSVQTAAQVRARECEQSFSHTRPNGSSFATALKEQNVSYRTAGENIAWGQRSPEEVVNAWMNSDGHRANILNAKFTSIGVGYYQNAKGVNYWSQLFIG